MGLERRAIDAFNADAVCSHLTIRRVADWYCRQAEEYRAKALAENRAATKKKMDKKLTIEK